MSPQEQARHLWEGMADWLEDESAKQLRFFIVADLNGWEVVRGNKQHHILTVGKGEEMKERGRAIALELERLAAAKTA